MSARWAPPLLTWVVTRTAGGYQGALRRTSGSTRTTWRCAHTHLDIPVAGTCARAELERRVRAGTARASVTAADGNRHRLLAPELPRVFNRDDLGCTGSDGSGADWFAPTFGGEVSEPARRALELCGRCPAKLACRDWARRNLRFAEYGIWGGETEQDRHRWRARTRQAAHRQRLLARQGGGGGA